MARSQLLTQRLVLQVLQVRLGLRVLPQEVNFFRRLPHPLVPRLQLIPRSLISQHRKHLPLEFKLTVIHLRFLGCVPHGNLWWRSL